MANGLTRYNRPRTLGTVVGGSADVIERRMMNAPSTPIAPMSDTSTDTGLSTSSNVVPYRPGYVGGGFQSQGPWGPATVSPNVPAGSYSTRSGTTIDFNLPGAEEALSSVFNPQVFSTGTGTSSRITPYQQAQIDLQREQLGMSRAEQEAAQARLARTEAAQQRGATAQSQYLTGLLSNLGAQYQPLLDELTRAQGAGAERIGGTYQTALQALQERNRQAGELTTQGYNALAQFLEQNRPQAFAGVQRAAAPALAPGAVEQYARAIGAPTGQIGQAAVQAATEQAAGGEAYNRLLDVLRAQEVAGAGSRAAETEMARATNAAQLQALLSGGQTQLEQQRAAAINALENQIQQQRFGVIGQQTQQQQALQQLLAQILGTGYVPFPA
jgi:hypothetical protein